MHDHEINQFQLQLLQMKAALEVLEATSKEATQTVVLDQSSVGRLSRMDAMQGQQMALESARRRKQQLLGIEGALQRIAKNDFGYCSTCGETIATARLAIDPTVTRCINCAE